MDGDGEPARKVQFDLLSLILSAIGFGGIVYALNALGEGAHGHVLIPAWLSALIGTIGLIAFGYRQVVVARKRPPLLDMAVFASRNFVIAISVLLVSTIGMFGVIILAPMYLQTVAGVTPLVAGLCLLPGGLAMGLLAPLFGRLYDRHGAAMIVLPATALAAVSLFAMASWSIDTPIAIVIATHVAFSLALSGIITPCFAAALGSTSSKLQSYGSATVMTVQQLGGAAGTALYVASMSMVTNSASAENIVLATSEGIDFAMRIGGTIALIAVVLALFLRRTKAEAGSVIMAH